ncbi:MAG: AMP-binding protein, partial [Deltaproteobacteria bacterium]|nr:AMP-binding protein [Deltaproteobacteria bacterium]
MTNDKNIHIPDGESYSIYAPEEGRTPAPWVQFYDEGVSASISPMHVPLYYWLDRSAQKFPNSPAIIFKNYRINYRQLLEGAEIIAANLRAHGIQKGDRVVLMMPNLPQTILAFWGVIKAGAVAVMTNPLYMSHELLHQLNDCEAKAMITVDFLWPKIKELRNDLGINKYFLTSMNEFMRLSGDPLCRFKVRRPRPLTGSASEDRRDVMPFARLLNGRKRLSVPIKNPNDDLALLQYTGGTTGIPKGAMLTHSNMVANQQQILEVLKAIVDKPNNRFLAVLPFFH